MRRGSFIAGVAGAALVATTVAVPIASDAIVADAAAPVLDEALALRVALWTCGHQFRLCSEQLERFGREAGYAEREVRRLVQIHDPGLKA